MIKMTVILLLFIVFSIKNKVIAIMAWRLLEMNAAIAIMARCLLEENAALVAKKLYDDLHKGLFGVVRFEVHGDLFGDVRFEVRNGMKRTIKIKFYNSINNVWGCIISISIEDCHDLQTTPHDIVLMSLLDENGDICYNSELGYPEDVEIDDVYYMRYFATAAVKQEILRLVAATTAAAPAPTAAPAPAPTPARARAPAPAPARAPERTTACAARASMELKISALKPAFVESDAWTTVNRKKPRKYKK